MSFVSAVMTAITNWACVSPSASAAMLIRRSRLSSIGRTCSSGIRGFVFLAKRVPVEKKILAYANLRGKLQIKLQLCIKPQLDKQQ
jgi:hypothetical protein